MRILLIALVSVLLLFACQKPAHAEMMSAQQFKVFIVNPNAIGAMGYVLGVHDTLQGVIICTPEDYTPVQLVSEIKDLFTKLPEKALEGKSADMIIGTYLQARFPCKLV